MTQGRCLADRFWILETIDASGTTELYLARDDELGEHVALRLLGAAFADRWQALRDACRETRPLAHPHIARVFDFHRAGGAPLLCREYVAGARIGDLAADSIADRLGALAQVAAALEAAHAQGVVHGDLKASKILRDERGAMRVTDFRVAAAMRAASSQAPAGVHASPQVRGGESPSAADDVYSLGVLAAQLFASEPLPRELGALLDAMRAPVRSARPQNLREIEQTLLAYAGAVDVQRSSASDADSRLRALPRGAALVEAPSDARRAALGDAAVGARRAASASRNRLYAIAGAALAFAVLAVFFALPRWVESRGEPRAAPEPNAPSQQPPVQLGDGSAPSASSDELARDALLAQQLAEGEWALEARDAARAAAAFDLALAIEPGHAAALEGAQRAREIAALSAHMAEGARLEAQDLADAARREYARAAEIDPNFASAREALARIDGSRADRDFEAELSLALIALADGKLGPARAHFEAARVLRPSSPEVIDGLRQLQQLESSRAIARQRALAEAAEGEERWSDAASHYQAILETQPHLPFAEQGLRRNRELTKLTERIAQLLADPAQLLQPARLDEARRLGESARTATNGKPKLGAQLHQLDAAIELASTPIEVAFESDAATEVVIRGVGTLGSFARRDFALKPGRYVVIGRRDGYRDTRTEIAVIPGARPPVVDVRCTEKI